MLAIEAVPASASAAVRTVTIGDPQDMGESTFDPNYCQRADLASVTVAYNDAAGTVSASFTFYNDLTNYCGDRVDSGLTLSTNGGVTPAPNGGIDVGSLKQYDGSRRLYANMYIEGILGSVDGAASLSADEHTISATFSNPGLASRDWRYVDGKYEVDPYQGAWFDGYAPVPVVIPPYDPANPDAPGDGGDASGSDSATPPTPAVPVGAGDALAAPKHYVVCGTGPDITWKIEPRRCLFAPEDNAAHARTAPVKRIRWRRWGGPRAYGRGVFYYNSNYRAPIRLRLYRRIHDDPNDDSVFVYTRLEGTIGRGCGDGPNGRVCDPPGSRHRFRMRVR
jgi:hypothetical protein